MKIEIVQQYGKYLFMLKAGNGRTLLRSTKYSTMGECLQKATSLTHAGNDGSRFERKKVGQKIQLLYKDASGTLVATGYLYSSSLTYAQGLRTILSLVKVAPIITMDANVIM